MKKLYFISFVAGIQQLVFNCNKSETSRDLLRYINNNFCNLLRIAMTTVLLQEKWKVMENSSLDIRTCCLDYIKNNFRGPTIN